MGLEVDDEVGEGGLLRAADIAQAHGTRVSRPPTDVDPAALREHVAGDRMIGALRLLEAEADPAAVGIGGVVSGVVGYRNHEPDIHPTTGRTDHGVVGAGLVAGPDPESVGGGCVSVDRIA